jgi:hypothetical protein
MITPASARYGTARSIFLLVRHPHAGTRYIFADSHSLAPQMVACTPQLPDAHSAVPGINDAVRGFRLQLQQGPYLPQ